MKQLIFSKRGQIGATLTWIFALLIIIFIIAIFITSTMAIAKLKGGRVAGSLISEKNLFLISEETIINENIAYFFNIKTDSNLFLEALADVEQESQQESLKKTFLENYGVFFKTLPSNYYVMDFNLQKVTSYRSGYEEDWPWMNLIGYSAIKNVYIVPQINLGYNLKIPIYEGKRLSLSLGKTK